MPAAHSIAAMMSESYPPHLPSARRGRIQGLQVPPAMPWPLLVLAAISDATSVPCHELSAWSQPLNFCDWPSCVVTQSPGSEGSESRPSPSFATVASEMKS